MSIACPACGHPDDGGDPARPTHAYMSASPACWARYGDVLAREYGDPAYWRTHRLLTDAYCGQHSISDDRRARQSLWIHLAALMLHFEDAAPEPRIVAFLRAAAKSEDFAHLPIPEASLGVRIDAVHAAASLESHHAAVAAYARAVYDAWSPHHGAFRGLIERVDA